MQEFRLVIRAIAPEGAEKKLLDLMRASGMEVNHASIVFRMPSAKDEVAINLLTGERT